MTVRLESHTRVLFVGATPVPARAPDLVDALSELALFWGASYRVWTLMHA